MDDIADDVEAGPELPEVDAGEAGVVCAANGCTDGDDEPEGEVGEPGAPDVVGPHNPQYFEQ